MYSWNFSCSSGGRPSNLPLRLSIFSSILPSIFSTTCSGNFSFNRLNISISLISLKSLPFILSKASINLSGISVALSILDKVFWNLSRCSSLASFIFSKTPSGTCCSNFNRILSCSICCCANCFEKSLTSSFSSAFSFIFTVDSSVFRTLSR